MIELTWLLEASVKGSVLLLGSLAGARLIRQAEARHRVLSLALAGLLLLTLLPSFLPALALPLPLAMPTLSRGVLAATDFTPEADLPALASIPVADSATTLRPGIGWPSPLGVWLLGFGFVALPLVLAAIRRNRLARAACRASGWSLQEQVWALRTQLGIRRPVRLLISDRDPIPATWGTVRPTLVLPARSLQWPATRIRAVLLHELAHVRRFDALSRLLSQATCMVFWFHPLAWITARRMLREQERACDELVLASGLGRHDYARSLLEVADDLGSRAMVPQALAFARPSHLESRLEAILSPLTRSTTMSRTHRLALSLAFIVLLLPLAAFRPQAPRPAPVVISPAPASALSSGQASDSKEFVLRIEGEVRLGPNLEATEVEPGGRLVLRGWGPGEEAQREEAGNRRFELAGEPDGSTRITWLVDQVESEFDAEAREWVDGILGSLHGRPTLAVVEAPTGALYSVQANGGEESVLRIEGAVRLGPHLEAAEVEFRRGDAPEPVVIRRLETPPAPPQYVVARPDSAPPARISAVPKGETVMDITLPAVPALAYQILPTPGAPSDEGALVEIQVSEAPVWTVVAPEGAVPPATAEAPTWKLVTPDGAAPPGAPLPIYDVLVRSNSPTRSPGARWSGWTDEDGTSVQIVWQGEITWATRLDALSMAPGSELSIEQRQDGRLLRRLVARPDVQGLQLLWRHDDRDEPLDADGREWVESVLTRLQGL